MTTTTPEPLSEADLAELRSELPTIILQHGETHIGHDEMVSAGIARRLLATVSALQSQVQALTAREAVLVEAVQNVRAVNIHNIGGIPPQILCDAQSRLTDVLANPSATALLEELKQLRAGQRTPGTKEVCAECNDHSWRSSCKWSLYAPSDHVCKIVRAAKESPT